MRKVNPVIPILAAAALVIAGVGAAAFSRGRLTPLRYFPETGRLLSDPFLAYFDQHGGLETFGYPLTDPYSLPGGTLVQTFQRAQIALTVRGVELAPINRTLRIGQERPGEPVAPEFASIHQALGGEAFFGPPFGEAHQENGSLVQDFERARLTRDAGGAARLADLGVMVVAVSPPPQAGQASIGLRGTPTPPPAVRASVSVEQPAVGQAGRQTIYLLVEDDRGQPIPAARSLAVLRYGAATAEVEMPYTDDSGIASASFLAPAAPPGSRVIVQMNVLVGEVFLTVDTTYFQWW
jgi:hypothetical protein